MNLLFITRRVDRNHPLAGFTWKWIKEFSVQLSVVSGQLAVITLEPSADEGLADNVMIRSVRKAEKNRVQDFFVFCKLLLSLIPKCDAIFIHQHPVYAIIAAPFAKLFNKKIYLWYMHKHVDIKLRLATALCNGIFTASKESFRLKTKRPISIVGHGIDTNIFKPSDTHTSSNVFTILSAGRLSPVKGYAVLIDAALLALPRFNNLKMRIVGGPGLKEHAWYENELKTLVHEKGLDQVIQFTGPVPHNDIVAEYRNAHVFINLSGTGSLDKAVLEAMACGVPVITSNEAFQGILAQIDPHLYVSCNPRAVAEAIERLITMPLEARRQLGGALRAVVVRDHDLKQLVARILSKICPVIQHPRGRQILYTENG
ncbi:MAG: glycosyltransferase family 4 protein [Patescibacteria group bacterium]